MGLGGFIYCTEALGHNFSSEKIFPALDLLLALDMYLWRSMADFGLVEVAFIIYKLI